jgi:hypothetical protein
VSHGVGVTQRCGSRAASPAGPVNLESMLRSSAGPVMPDAGVETVSVVVLLGRDSC